jgi:LysM repeat protein
MRLRLFLLISALAGALLIVPATASAYFVHVVAPGESLFSIAAADGLTIDQLAAANGLSVTTQLVAGSTLQIPPQSGAGSTVASSSGASSTAASATPAATTGDGDNDADDVGSSASAAPASSGGSYVVQPGDTLTGIASRAGLSPDSLASANGLDPSGVLVSGTVLHLSGGTAMVPASTTVPVSTTSAQGAYVVQPGDTLTAIATRAGLSTQSLAAANGLDPNGVLVSGTVLHLSGSPAAASSGSAATSQPVGPAAEGTPTDPPYPTPERVTAPQVGSIASANGVPASLAAAIAWQESGFNNDLVSSSDARGVMQILPGTWQWIQNSLDTGGPPLAPASAADNVRGGVLMLHSLLDATGGDPAMAAAGYYQGLPSVQQHGMYPDTQRYVQNVLSLERQFGGGG